MPALEPGGHCNRTEQPRAHSCCRLHLLCCQPSLAVHNEQMVTTEVTMETGYEAEAGK